MLPLKRFTPVGFGIGWAIALGFSLSAQAATLQNGWFYSIDSFDDGVTGGAVGGGVFEFYGLAIKAEAETLTIALNANLPLSGYAAAEASDGVIHWGDLFFNFSGQDFATAAAAGNLFGVRFNEENDSGVDAAGVYSNVTPTSVVATNSGFSSFSDYNATVLSQGGTPSFGDLPADTNYFDLSAAPPNAIAAGTKMGELDWAPNLTGLDFASLGAVVSETIAVSFERSLLPEGSFIAHVLAECANDGIAIAAVNPFARPGTGGPADTSVPEPGSALAVVGLGLCLIKRGKLWQRA